MLWLCKRSYEQELAEVLLKAPKTVSKIRLWAYSRYRLQIHRTKLVRCCSAERPVCPHRSHCTVAPSVRRVLTARAALGANGGCGAACVVLKDASGAVVACCPLVSQLSIASRLELVYRETGVASVASWASPLGCGWRTGSLLSLGHPAERSE
jgi:hypothetical protein